MRHSCRCRITVDEVGLTVEELEAAGVTVSEDWACRPSISVTDAYRIVRRRRAAEREQAELEAARRAREEAELAEQTERSRATFNAVYQAEIREGHGAPRAYAAAVAALRDHRNQETAQ